MYLIARKLFAHVANKGDDIRIENHDHRVIQAIALYRVILSDGRVRREELDHYHHLLEDRLHVDEDEMELFDRVVTGSAKAAQDAKSLLEGLQELDEEERRELVEMMKEISLADRELHELEINLIVLAQELLGLKRG